MKTLYKFQVVYPILKISRTCLLFSLTQLSTFCFGQLFSKVIPQNAVGVSYSHNAWVDFDNDGDLDFLITGAASTNDLRTMLYENVGNDIFRPALAPFNGLPQYSESEIAFLNNNGDDRIDLLLMGRRIGIGINRMSLLENRTTGFADLGSLPSFGNPGGYGTISVGDVNGDGTSDIFVSGVTGSEGGSPTLAAYLYLNYNGTYTKGVGNNFIGLYIAASKLVDIDSDQDLDLILCGSDGTFPYQNSLLYLNDGNGNFQLTPTSFVSLQNPSIDVADYDNDNDLDLLFTGLDQNFLHVTKLYRNTAGSFTNVTISTSLNRTASGSAKWGDYDNDGDLDILITGQTGPNAAAIAVFQNNGQGVFSEISDSSFEQIGLGLASWGDYDSDGDLDILVTGALHGNPDVIPTLYILKNGTVNKSTKPDQPGNFKVTYDTPNSFSLSWDSSTDDLTPASSLTYNLSILNTISGKYLIHPFSDNVSGKRRVNEHGNVFLNRKWKIKDLANGTYTLKVQTIDGIFQGSSWTESFFYAGLPNAPSNLKLSYTEKKIKLTWSDNSNNEEFFVIERSINNGGYVKLDSTNSNVITFDDPYEGHSLNKYRVSAVNPNQRSAYSNSVETTIDAPTNLQGTYSEGKVKLDWMDKSYSEKYFVIERSLGDGQNFIKVDSVSVNIITFTEQELPDGLYTYRIYAVNPLQKSGYSNTANILVTGLEPREKQTYIYPNPTTDIVFLKVDNPTQQNTFIDIISTNGTLALSKLLTLDVNGEAELNTSSLPTGLYLLKIKRPGGKVESLKLFKR